MLTDGRNSQSSWKFTSSITAAFCASIALCAISGSAPAQDKIPQFMQKDLGWVSVGGFVEPPAGMRGPIGQHPAHAFHGNLDGPGQVTPPIGNWEDPVLKPWVAAHMKKTNDEVLSGERSLAFTAQSRCYPGGVPGQLLYPIEPMYFIQKPNQIWMVWQRDQMVRRIYLTDRHSEIVKPSWFGESIGHYENGELVVDTIGLQAKDKYSYINNFRTPHSEKLHVTERYKILPNGNTLEAFIKLDDPDAFNEPLYMIKRWRKAGNPFLETVCAENNVDVFYTNLVPIPRAKKADF
ncbi:MAG TPA: hypothetical protein VK148_00060 [Xanthobacteraceae bacterium]|jgi:hypothetical protein|nr:hypothetical protein [Xanthobacteraceae bacterium]